MGRDGKGGEGRGEKGRGGNRRGGARACPLYIISGCATGRYEKYGVCHYVFT